MTTITTAYATYETRLQSLDQIGPRTVRETVFQCTTYHSSKNRTYDKVTTNLVWKETTKTRDADSYRDGDGRLQWESGRTWTVWEWVKEGESSWDALTKEEFDAAEDRPLPYPEPEPEPEPKPEPEPEPKPEPKAKKVKKPPFGATHNPFAGLRDLM